MHTNNEQSKPMSRCDELNVQYMRWYLRKHLPERGQDEWKLLHDLVGTIRGIRLLKGRPFPREVDLDDLRAAIWFAVWQGLSRGSFYGFSEAFLRVSATEHLDRFHFLKVECSRDQARALSEQGQRPQRMDPDTLLQLSLDDSPEKQWLREVRDKLEELLPQLNNEEAYLIGWLLAEGLERGAITRAASMIGKPTLWSTRRLEKIAKKAKRLLDGTDGK